MIPDVSNEHFSTIFKDNVEHKDLDKCSTLFRNVGMTYQMTHPYIPKEHKPQTINNEIYNQNIEDAISYKTAHNFESVLKPSLCVINL